MELEIRIDRTRCIGSGQCVYVAPRAFDQDGDAKAFVTDAAGEPEERIVHAVAACPVQAITLQIGATRITAEDLKDWAHGTHGDDPLVERLAQLCDDHHELGLALAATESHPTPEHVSEICAMTRAHLHNEDAAYSSIAALVDPQLVDAFEADHEAMVQALDELVDAEAHPQAISAFSGAVRAHIRLEETVLFPLALAALAR